MGLARIENLVLQFAEGRDEYILPQYNETQVRVEFVNPFFKALGWDVDNDAGLRQHLREVVHEASVLVADEGRLRTKKPDYSFRIGSEQLFYLEAKKPSVNIAADSAPSFQLRRYGWSGNRRISVLTNFNDLYIYDCSVRPLETDDLNTALIAHYHHTEYVEKFDEIYDMLSRESAADGSFNAWFANVTAAFRHEPFDGYFLQQISQWRLELAQDIHSRNPDLDDETLNICVQRILNRIIFLRICEDRSFESYETLARVRTCEELRELFIAADRKYDSGLFQILEEDNVALSDDVILNIFRDLYYPNSPYEFNAVDPFIIGQIYELFLAGQVSFSGSASGETVPKPEAIDSHGAVNTPKLIADIIVEQTLSKLFEGKSPEDTVDIRVADICCGSGNFLLSAYEYIVNHTIDWLVNNDRVRAVRDGSLVATAGDTFRLSYAKRREILERNIWGVDVDPLAVEVAKFSLLIKLLEHTGRDEVEAYRETTRNPILPCLDNTIKNGNSLVGMALARYAPDIFERASELERIRMFDWNEEFGPEGFDAIIGNPPYIRIQNITRYSPLEYGFYKSDFSEYQTARTDLFDKYFLFIEKAWSLLKPDGTIGYIVPHKFMTLESGGVLRQFLASRNALKRIIHFGDNQVFRNTSTYTCILLLEKDTHQVYEIAFVRDLNIFFSSHGAEYETYAADTLGAAPWTFLPRSVKARLDAIESHCCLLKDIADIFVGVQTSNDKIYIIAPEREDDAYVYFRDKAGAERKIEKGILRHCLYDTKIRKYEPIVPNRYIIFPYRDNGGHAELIDLLTLRTSYPLAYEYFLAFKEELGRRSMVPERTASNWHAYGRNQSLARFMGGEHLVWPVLSRDSNYVYDPCNVVFTGGGNGPFYGIVLRGGVEESILYVQAIMNHWLMELLVKTNTSVFRGGYYSHGKQFIARLPIFRIDFSDPAQKAAHDAIVDKVRTIQSLVARRDTAGSTATKRTIDRAIKMAQNDVSLIIDALYGVQRLRAGEDDEDD